MIVMVVVYCGSATRKATGVHSQGFEPSFFQGHTIKLTDLHVCCDEARDAHSNDRCLGSRRSPHGLPLHCQPELKTLQTPTHHGKP